MKLKQLSLLKFRTKRKKIIAFSLVFMFIIPLSIIHNNDFISQVYAYDLKVDEAVDADSNIDAVANIGTDAATDYTDAQTLNTVDQTLIEGNGAGYVAPSSVNELHDAITNLHAPVDLGTYSNDANMQADDSTMNTLTEADTGGGGVNAYIFVDGISTAEISWITVGTSPYLDAQDQPTNLLESTNGAISSWYTFGATTGSGTGFTVNASIYDSNVGDAFIVWEIDWTNDGTADATGSFASQSTFAWQNTGTITGLDTATEINDARIRFVYDKGGGGPDLLTLDASRLGVSQSGGANYEFDREFSFTGISPTTNTIERLDINTGIIGTESLKVEIWESSAWVTVVTIVDANDNTWINTSITTWLDAATEDFRFLGNIETSDTTENTWEIDMVLIHTESSEILDYELQWEHQAQNVDMAKDTYNITIYGFSSEAETFEIQTWDIGGTSWNTALSLTIGTNEQWYNQTIEANAHDQGNSITWRYRGTSETGDTTQTTLNIDYAGISAWNFTVAPLDLDNWGVDVVRPDDTYYSINITSVRFNVSAGVDYILEISGTNGFGNPVTNNYVYWDTDSNPVGSTLLTTSFVTLYSSLPAGDGIVSLVYIWFKVPFGTPDQIDPRLVVTLNIQIIKA